MKRGYTRKSKGFPKRKSEKRKQLISIKRVIGNFIENKSFLNGNSGIGVSYSCTQYVVLSNMAQGVLDNERVGDSISIKHVRFGFHATANTTLPATQIMRMIFFQWHPDTTVATGANPDANSIIQNGGAALGYAVDQPITFDFIKGKNFKIIKDLKFALDAQKPTSGTFKLRKFNHKSQFNGGATTGFNQIHVLFLSNISTTGAGPNLTWTSQCVYRDA